MHARRFRPGLFSIAILCPLVASSLRGAALPSDAVGGLNGLGVNIHFTDPRPGEMKMLTEAGFKWVRMDFSWNAIERRRGRYDFRSYDRLLESLDPFQIHPVFILDYSNRNYDDDLSPRTETGRRAFADWAVASAIHYRGRGVIWEMYNEPNIKFWRPKPNFDDYAKLAVTVGRALQKSAPDAVYIGPACSTMDFKFLETCFKAGCLNYWSAVSVHPYRQKAPETVSADYRRLREMIARYAPGRSIPIISGEWGYSSAWRRFDERRQGQYLPRELLTNIAEGVPLSIWYDWHDDGTDRRDAEDHFGAVHNGYRRGTDPVYEPKPAWIAMRAMTATLRGSSFARRIETGRPEDQILLFEAPDGARLAVWTTGAEHDVKIPCGPGRFRATGHLGERFEDIVADSGGLTVRLTQSPKYLSASRPDAHVGAGR